MKQWPRRCTHLIANPHLPAGGETHEAFCEDCFREAKISKEGWVAAVDMAMERGDNWVRIVCNECAEKYGGLSEDGGKRQSFHIVRGEDGQGWVRTDND